MIEHKALAFMVMVMLCSPMALSADGSSAASKLQQSISTPPVPGKAVKCIKSHMTQIEEWLNRHGLQSRLTRDDEVILVTIPCGDVFTANTAEINSLGQEKLLLLKDVVKYGTMYKLVVAVHSDDTGDATYRQQLTEARSESVRNFLSKISEGKDFNVIEMGMNNAQPLVSNDTMSGRSQNRRIEIYIVPEWQIIDTAKSGRLCKK